MNTGIVYLIDRRLERLQQFVESLINLKKFYLDNFPTKVYALIETQDITLLSPYMQRCVEISGVDLTIVPVDLPDMSRWQAENYFVYHTGYKQMCAFFSAPIFNTLPISVLDYYWRQDTDSKLIAPIEYDVFEYLKQNNSPYGYIAIHEHGQECTDNFAKECTNWAKANYMQFNQNWDNKKLHFYNNFEIAHVPSFRYSSIVQDLYRFLYETGGYMKWRWGDHIFRYVTAVELEKFNCVKMPHIKYWHSDHVYETE